MALYSIACIETDTLRSANLPVFTSLTRSGIEPRPPAPQADALTTVLRRGGVEQGGQSESVFELGTSSRLVHDSMRYIQNISIIARQAKTKNVSLYI